MEGFAEIRSVPFPPYLILFRSNISVALELKVVLFEPIGKTLSGHMYFTWVSAPQEDQPLIPSLFPTKLRPSIKFAIANTADNLKRRRLLFSHLKWIRASYIPAVQIVGGATGLTLVPARTHRYGDWFGFVNIDPHRHKDSRRPERVIRTSSGGKYSQMPRSTTLAYKVSFLRHFRRYQARFPKAWDSHMPAFILPDEIEEFKTNSSREDDWIYKPSEMGQSNGIVRLRGSNLSSWNHLEMPGILQSFMDDPFLLNEAKVEPRFHVFLTSIHPVRIYVSHNSLTKLVHDYELNNWTGVNVIKASGGRVVEEQTFKHFWPRMTELGWDVETLKAQMYDIIIKAILMGEREMTEAGRGFRRRSSYQYYSADFMWRRTDMKPFLIELNRFPSLVEGAYYKHHRRNLADMLTLAGHQVNLTNATRDYLEGQTSELPPSCDCKEVITQHNLGLHVTDEEILELMEAEDELNRMKETSFLRIFPSPDMANYFQYVESDIRPYLVQAAWERVFGVPEGRREDGICYLKCQDFYNQVPRARDQ